MAQYVKTEWINDEAPARNADNLNKQEQGIFDNSTHAESAHAPSDAEKNSINTVIDADYVHTDNNYTDSDKAANILFNEPLNISVASESSAVPTDFDFINFREALDYLKSGIMLKDVTLYLQEGLHYIDRQNSTTLESSDDDENFINCNISGTLTIRSATNDFDATVITVSPMIETISGGTLCDFRNVNDGVIKFYRVTFDVLAGGAELSLNYSKYIKANNFQSNYFPVKNAYVGLEIGGNSDVGNAEFENCNFAILPYANSTVMADNGSFTDCIEAIYFSTPSINCIVSLYNTDFINTPIVTSGFKLNKIDPYSRNIILTDNSIVWAGDTASRPVITTADERSYFDTTLGKPVWYNGTEWTTAEPNAAKIDVPQTFTSAQRTAIITQASSGIPFNDSNNIITDWGALDTVNVANQTKGQSGNLILEQAENVVGWATNFDWGNAGVPIDLSGTEKFSYFILADSGVNSIIIGRV